jgi:hypothetical protein
MTLIETGTAEAHLASCRGKGLHSVQQVDETAVAVFPEADIAADSKASNFATDFVLEHSSTDVSLATVAITTDSDDRQMSKTHIRRRS